MEEELEIERELGQQHAENMDKFYRQNPPNEERALQNILQTISEDYLELNQNNQQLKKQIKELENSLKIVENIFALNESETIKQPSQIQEERKKQINIFISILLAVGL